MTKMLLGLLSMNPGTDRGPVGGGQTPLVFLFLPDTVTVCEVYIIPDVPGGSPGRPLPNTGQLLVLGRG